MRPVMFKQSPIAVLSEQEYAKLHALIEAAFDAHHVEGLLKRVIKAHLRIRDYESVLRREFLGKEAIELYAALPVSDQGLTREHYMQMVEKVPIEVRQPYLKAYAYY